MALLKVAPASECAVTPKLNFEPAAPPKEPLSIRVPRVVALKTVLLARPFANPTLSPVIALSVLSKWLKTVSELVAVDPSAKFPPRGKAKPPVNERPDTALVRPEFAPRALVPWLRFTEPKLKFLLVVSDAAIKRLLPYSSDGYFAINAASSEA